MCGLISNIGTQPYRIVLDRDHAENGAVFETFTFALAKVTEFHRRTHRTMYNFTYPIGQTVYDPNARVKSRSTCLHFLPSMEAAPSYRGYGDHIVIALPAQKLWDRPKPYGKQPAQCWHSNGCTPLFCATCLGLTPADLQHDACWRDFTIPRRRSAVSTASNRQQVLPVPRDNVWHKRVEVNPATMPQHALGGKLVW
jgi:hypothetical protein